MKIRLLTQLDNYMREADEIVRAFSPYIEISEDAEDYILLKTTSTSNSLVGIIESSLFAPIPVNYSDDSLQELEFKRRAKRLYKNTLYTAISTCLDMQLPYGSLTGVRPTKLLYEVKKQGLNADYLVNNYFVDPKKATLLDNILASQEGIYSTDDNRIDLFVNIPFCPTRCTYCSFISTEYKRIERRIPEYVDCVKQEIALAKRLINTTGKTLSAIYVGGGTPTVLNEKNLWEILSGLRDLAPEFTVECGRPDTITKEKIAVLTDLGVTRVSINPQTFFDDTLVAIGRRHTVADFYRAYELFSGKPFVKNIDLIAGLTGETTEMFRTSLDKAIALAPENITVHSLSLKRGAKLTELGAKKGEFGSVGDMLDYAHVELPAKGYGAYYLYRQKNCSDNLENTGYAKKGTECIYNVDIMEDTTSIIGVGAGAMSKLVSNHASRIERYSTPKGLEEYLARIDEILDKKSAFFLP